jgi:hypothetical protein
MNLEQLNEKLAELSTRRDTLVDEIRKAELTINRGQEYLAQVMRNIDIVKSRIRIAAKEAKKTQ